MKKPVEDVPPIAADGGPVPGACNTAAAFLATIEDGQFDCDLNEAIKRLAIDMRQHAEVFGSAAGSIAINISFKTDEDRSDIHAEFKVKAPKAKRPRSIMWITEDGRMTPVKPNQGQLFGIRDVTGKRDVRG